MTVNLPDILYQRVESLAAKRATSVEELVTQVMEREVEAAPPATAIGPRRVQLPLLRSKDGRKLDLSNFDFDDLLA